jgi:hypothetical protein
METSLVDFRTEVRICSQQKFGRMDQKVTRGMLAAEKSEQIVAKTAEDIASMPLITICIRDISADETT